VTTPPKKTAAEKKGEYRRAVVENTCTKCIEP
jgi:hypothetical protein